MNLTLNIYFYIISRISYWPAIKKTSRTTVQSHHRTDSCYGFRWRRPPSSDSPSVSVVSCLWDLKWVNVYILLYTLWLMAAWRYRLVLIRPTGFRHGLYDPKSQCCNKDDLCLAVYKWRLCAPFLWSHAAQRALPVLRFYHHYYLISSITWNIYYIYIT